MLETPTPPTVVHQGGDVGHVRATCLHLATRLGDLIEDLVVVGGLVPSLIVDQETLAVGVRPHLGTSDLDIGLALALLERERYRELAERLRDSGFERDRNVRGNLTRQRWRIDGARQVTLDFLIQPSLQSDRGGQLRDILPDFAAIIAPGLHLAFEDRLKITLSGRTILGDRATRAVWVCGPGAYVVLKALAFYLRGKEKDAYDLFYVIRNYEGGVEAVATHLRPFLGDDEARKALAVLRNDFADLDGLGPRSVARFVHRDSDDILRADVVGHVQALLRSLPC
jgi:hypothetical protein